MPPSTPPKERKSETLENSNGQSPLRRSNCVGESLHSSTSTSKQCAGVDVSESEMNIEKKRKKNRLLTQVTMESKKAEVHVESVVMKRKKMTGRQYKSLLNKKCQKEILPAIRTEELALSQSEKLPSYQDTEEQVHSVYSKKGCLKRIYSQCTSKTIDSGRDHLLAEEDINQEKSNVDEGTLPFSSLKLKEVKKKIEKDSAKEEQDGAPILSQQKLAVKNKGEGSEVDDFFINKIQKKGDLRMNILIQKQQEQIQEFHRIWEEKRSNLERDHKLEAAIIRSIHHDSSTREDKLKLLDGKFAKKMEENNVLKDVQLKNLEAKQLADWNEETQKVADWVAKVKAYSSSEPKAVYGSLSSQSEEVGRCSQLSTHIIGAAKDVMPLTGQNVEDNNTSKSVQENDVAPSKKSVSAPAEEVGCNVPIGNSNTSISTDPQNKEVAFSERSALDVVEQLDQPKNIGAGEVTSVKLTASGESVPDEMRPVELNKEVPSEVPETAANEILDYANSVELSSMTLNEGFDKGDAIGLPDGLVNHGNGTDETTTSGLPSAGLILEPSEQTNASSHNCALLPPDVPEDQIHRCLVSGEIQDEGAQVVEKQNTSPFEVAAPEHVDTIRILQSNIELQDRDAPAIQSTPRTEVAASEIIDTVTPEESNVELQDRDSSVLDDQVTLQIEAANLELADTANLVPFSVDASPVENCEEPHLMSIDVSPSCNQPSSIEVENQSDNLQRNFCQTAEITATEVLSHESASQLGENLELQSNYLDIGSEGRVAHETNVRLSASSENNVAMSQMVVSTVELPHQAALQLGTSVGSSYLFSPPYHQVASWNSPRLFAAPLENELERIRKETEQLQKSHKDVMLQLKSDHEKEIQEIIAQVNNKYELKLQDAEAEFTSKMNGLETIQKKFFVNNILAKAFSSSCLDFWSSGLPGMQQGIPASSTPHLHHPSLQHQVRSPPVAIASLPALNQQIPSPNIQVMQHLSRQHSTSPRHITCQNFSSSSLQTSQHSASLSFGTATSRPLVINTISPTGNPRFGGGIRSLAPHLQPLRHGAALSTPTASFPSIIQPQLQSFQPLHSPPPAMMPPPPPAPPQPPSASWSRPQHQGESPAPFYPSLSAPEFLMNVDDPPHIPGNRISSRLPESSSAFGSLERSCLDTHTLGNVQGNPTSSAIATDVVCLSDDD